MKIYLALVIVTIVLAVAVAVLGCDSTGIYVHTQAGFVRGVVSDEETGSPLDSVAMRVLVVANDTLVPPVYTDSSGYYVILVGRPGKFYVMARKDGYQTATTQVNIKGGDTAAANFELVREL